MGFVWRAVAPGLLAMFVALASPVPVLADNPVSIDSLLTRAAELKVEGKLVEAVPLVREALRRAEARYGVDARATQEVVSNLGRLYLELDRIDEAGVQFERVFARTERVLGKSHTDYPRYASWLGRIRFLQERYAEAKILFTATRDGYAKLRGPDNREVAHGESNLGEIAERNGDLTLAERHYREAERIYAMDTLRSPHHHINSLHALGRVLRAQGKTDEAIAILEPLYAQVESTLGSDPSSSLRGELAAAFRDAGRFSDALTLAENDLQFALAAEPQTPWLVIDRHILVGSLNAELNNAAIAEQHFRSAIANPGPPSESVEKNKTRARYHLAQLLADQGRRDEAIELLEIAVEYLSRNSSDDSSNLEDALELLSGLYTVKENYVAALPHLRRLVAIRDTPEQQDEPQFILNLLTLGTALSRAGELGPASAYLQRVVRLAEALQDPQPILLAGSLSNLGDVYMEQQRYSEAEALFRRAIPLSDSVGDEWRGKWQHQKHQLGMALYYQDFDKDAEDIWLEVVGVLTEEFGADTFRLIPEYEALADLYLYHERYLEAAAAYKEAGRLSAAEFGADSGNAGYFDARLGEMYAAVGELEAAETVLVRAEDVYRRQRGAFDPSTLWIQDLLARVREELEEEEQESTGPGTSSY